MLHTIIQIFVQYQEGLMSGLAVSLKLIAIVWISGLFIGTFIGWYAHRKLLAGYCLKLGWLLVSSVPVLVILFWLHFPLQKIIGIVVDPFITAASALSVINIIFVSIIIKNALDDFPEQYAIAGRVTGLSEKEIFFSIKFPLIIRSVIPQLLFLQVAMLQATIFASLISVEEIFRVAQRINSLIYKPVEIYTVLAMLFLAVCLPLNYLAYWLKNKYTRNLSEK